MKSYIAGLTGMIIGAFQHYYYMKMLWYGFKPVAQTIDRRLSHR